MRLHFLCIALASSSLPGAALAQTWVPASEIVGQPVQVTTNGVVNTVYLDAGGSARILTPAGRAVPGSWTASHGQLCLYGNGGTECWPYAAPFQAGQPVTLASSCNSSSTWLAQAVNAAPPPPPPAPAERGERGR